MHLNKSILVCDLKMVNLIQNIISRNLLLKFPRINRYRSARTFNNFFFCFGTFFFINFVYLSRNFGHLFFVNFYGYIVFFLGRPGYFFFGVFFDSF